MSRPEPDAEVHPEGGALRSLLAGFAFALAAAGCWGVGNVATRWTLLRHPQAAFDVVFLKYLVAAALLAVAALVARAGEARPAPVRLAIRSLPRGRFLAAALAKGLNTYCWVLAAARLPAGPVATLENLHIVWAGLAAAAFYRQRVPRRWVVGAGSALAGATLITATPAALASSAATGVVLGLGAGWAFAGFVVLWSGMGMQPRPLWERTLATALLLLVSGLLLYPMHLAVSAFLGGGTLWPLWELGSLDAAVQCINGLFGIGAAYFLLNEASARLERAGKMSVLLLAVGLSFAIPVTLLTEALVLGATASAIQWAGVMFFVAGFVAVRGSLARGANR